MIGGGEHDCLVGEAAAQLRDLIISLGKLNVVAGDYLALIGYATAAIGDDVLEFEYLAAQISDGRCRLLAPWAAWW